MKLGISITPGVKRGHEKSKQQPSPAPEVIASISDMSGVQGDLLAAINLDAVFAGTGLSYGVSGPADLTDTTLTPRTDTVGTSTVTVRATATDGQFAEDSFDVTVAALAVSISGTPEVGQTLTASASADGGSFQWQRNGADMAGVTVAAYDVVAEDDGTEIGVVYSRNGATVSPARLTVTYAAPSAGALPDASFVQGSGVQEIAAPAVFSGAVGGAWSVSGAGATIDASGLVSIPTDTALPATAVTVGYTNSGGTAATSFSVAIEAAPVLAASPAYAEASLLGTYLSSGPLSIPAPAGTASGDTLVFILHGNTTTPPTITPPEGAQQVLATDVQPTSGGWLQVYEMPAPIDGAIEYAFGISGTAYLTGLCLRLSPGGALAPEDVVIGAETPAQSSTTGPVATGNEGDLVLDMVFLPTTGATIDVNGGAPDVLHDAPGTFSATYQNTVAVNAQGLAAAQSSIAPVWTHNYAVARPLALRVRPAGSTGSNPTNPNLDLQFNVGAEA